MRFLVVALMVTVMLSAFSVAFAATMPVFERLQPITANLSAPSAVALDKYGCVIVAEASKNRVVVFSQSGMYSNTLNDLSKPISVAVDDNLRIYVGNNDTGNVEVYDDEFNHLFKLGEGDGEFLQPGSIAVADNGAIYVADSVADMVKVYNSDGSFSFSFGSSGKSDGEFNFPTSIAIDENAGELIITDLQLTKDMFSGDIEGARVQVFSMAGAFKRSFGEYGIDDGQMARPMGVAVDKDSRIYVTDSQQHIVHVFDSAGLYLGDIYDADNQMRTPMGIAVSSGNRLYVASLRTGTTEIYGLDQYTNMKVSPLSLSFEGNALETLSDQNIVISNNGTEVLNWTATKSSEWISISAASGDANISGESVLSVGVTLSGMSTGEYAGTVTVRASSGDTEIINVSLTVVEAPVLSLNPTSLEFTSINGVVPVSESISVTNTGGGTLSWTATSNDGWIAIDNQSGTGSGTITVTVDPSSKSAGTYIGSITVTGESAVNSPSMVAVSLNVVELFGSIGVTTNNEDATFTINGPESFSGSGTSAMVSQALTGSYTIVYGGLDGYITPASSTKRLEEGATISFDGQYVKSVDAQESEFRSVIAGAGPTETNSGLVKVFNHNGLETDLSFIAHDYAYGVNVAAGDLDNDGYDEIITSPGAGPENPAEIRMFDRNGSELTGLRIQAFDYKYGVNIASADFNSDGYYEVVAGAGGGPNNPAEVKIFVYDSGSGGMVDSGVTIDAYDSLYGVNVAAGDIDNDGKAELITTPGPGETNRAEVKVWDVDTSLGIGQWSLSELSSYTVETQLGYSMTVASGDTNGDGQDEVITGAGPDNRARDDIRVHAEDGSVVTEFRAYIIRGYGANIGSGDMDGDGVDEIVVGSGSGPRNRAIVKIFSADGVETVRFRAFDSRYGVNVAVGYLGL